MLVLIRMATDMRIDYRAPCKNCGKSRGLHNSVTKACPAGMRTRIGYTGYNPDKVFEDKYPRSPNGYTA